MTLNEYINNPYGTNSISIQARESIKASYMDKLDKIYLRENNKQFDRVLLKGDKSWFIYIKVPSEVIPNFEYDVVIEFLDPESHVSLYDCQVRFFSNDPAFMYSAYVYDQNGLFIKELSHKLPSKALTVKSEKNPKNVPGYIKSIYFAYLMCKRYGFANKAFFEGHCRKYHKAELNALVMHASDKLRDRQQEEEVLKSTKASKEKIVSRKDFENKRSKQLEDKVAKSITTTKRTKTVGHGVNKTVKTTKRTRRR